MQSRRASRDGSASRALVGWCGYATLAISTLLSLLAGTDDTGLRLMTLGIAALAAVWIYVAYTRMPSPAGTTGPGCCVLRGAAGLRVAC